MANGTAYPRVGDPSPQARAEREKHWRRVVARHQQSGLSRSAFCRRDKVPEGALSWWTRELKRRDQSGRSAPGKPQPQRRSRPSAFVPVRVIQASPPSGTSALEVVTPGGHVVRLQPDFDPALLRKVLAALEGRTC